MKAYWWRRAEGANFGDQLMPELFRRLAGVELEWAPPPEAELFGIGSNLHLVRPGFRGLVWGTGSPHPSLQLDLSGARVLALRGPLSAAQAGLRVMLLADPGLLAADLLGERPEPDIELGVIRHFADRRALKGHLIDVLAGVDFVIAEAARCQRIAASSLHGLILADALGIPNRWIPHPAAPPFKFLDYAGAFGEHLVPGVWRLASPAKVAEKQRDLRLAMAAVAEAVTV